MLHYLDTGCMGALTNNGWSNYARFGVDIPYFHFHDLAWIY